MHSKFDNFTLVEKYDSYDEWRNGSASLQSDGNVTLLKFSHGYVKCDSNCDDCEGKDDATEKCADYNHTEYKDLLETLEFLTENVPSYNWTLRSYLKLDCKCKDWCSDCDDKNLVSLPGDEDGNKRHMQNNWYKLKMHCKDWETRFNNNGTMCKLFDKFSLTMNLTVIGFL